MAMTRRQWVQGLAAGSLLGGVSWSGDAAAQAVYPTRPIRVVVPYGPGSSADLGMRLFAPKMTQVLGQPLITENRAGATGVIGTDFVARSAPDGYTLCMGTVASHATMVPLSPKLPYNVLRDFVCIGRATSSPAIIVIHPGVPARNLAEFVAWTKTKPGGVSYASSGIGGSGHLATELLRLSTGANLVHVPYNDAGRAVTDMVAGQVQAMIYYASVVPFVRSGQLRAIAVMSDKRIATLPDVATTQEQGFAGLTVSAWSGLFGPAGLPDTMRDQLYEALGAAVADPSIQPQLQTLGSDPAPLPPAEFRRFVEGEITKWSEVVRVAGIKLD